MRIGKTVNREYGFTYIGLMLFIALAGIAMSVIGPVWHAEIQREKEKELLFIGQQFSEAIGKYYLSAPGGEKQFPLALEDLIQDKRFPVTRRYLRKVFVDPMTGTSDWGLVRQQGRIIGVYSLSKLKPIKREGFPQNLMAFANASSYQDWRFNYSDTTGLAPVGLADNFSSVNTATPSQVVEPQLVVPETSATHVPAPISSKGAEKQRHRAACARTLSSDTDNCNATCGGAAGDVCQACYSSVISKYETCVSGQ